MVQSLDQVVVVGLAVTTVTLVASELIPVAMDWIQLTGHLHDQMADMPLAGRDIEIIVNGVVVYTGSTDYYGDYSIDAQFEEGGYDIRAYFPGDAGHDPDSSPLVQITAWRPTTSITIGVTPTSGIPPLDVTISGTLTRDDTGGAINVPVKLFKDGSEIDSQFQGTDGQYSFADIIGAAASVTYYTLFEGNIKFQGCEGVILPCPGCRHPVDSRGREEVACGFCGAVSEVVPIIG